MKNEFVLAFNEVLEEKGLPKEVIVNALESAMVSAYRRAVNASNAQQVDAKVDLETGKVTIFAEKEVVEQVQDPRTEVTVAEARHYQPDTEVGQMVVVESTPRDFGRVAAQTARQVIQQRIRDAERQAQLVYFDKQIGEIISGVVQAANAQGLTVGLEMRAEGSMPRKELIPGERFRVHDRVRALLAEVKNSPRGPQIILSRTHRNFLRRLLENEVPEIYHGIVEIRSIAREPGERAKVAVYATQQGIDPVGACVGIRGVRIQAIVRELHDEKIDVIEWNPDPAAYIAKALSPARVLGVYLNEKSPSGGKTATVVVPEDQLSLAIGRDGQNARLAAKLTGWRIDIKSLPEATTDVVYRLQNEPAMAPILEAEQENIGPIEELLARKAENRPLSPEEYDRMTKFVDRVEKRAAAKRQPEKKVEATPGQEELRKHVAAEAFDLSVLDSSLPEHVSYTLQENGYTSVGDLVLQMKINADEILKLQGIGPRAVEEITRLVDESWTEEVGEAQVAEALAEEPVPSAPENPTQAQQIDEVPGGFEELATADLESMADAEDLRVVPTDEMEQMEGKTEPAAKIFGADTISQDTMEAAVPVAEPGEPQPEETEEEEEPSFDELFTMRPEVTEDVTAVDEEEDQSGDKSKKKGKRKGRKHVEIEYDPEQDLTIIRKKHKRGGDDWWEA